jgi:hypothetical protein
VDRSGTASGPGWDADTAAADPAAAPRRFPARLPPSARGGRSAPGGQLRTVLSALTRPGHMSATAGWEDEALGHALVFRLWPARVLHVVGGSLLASEFRRLLAVGAVPGWDLHPVLAGHTPLHVLAGPLHRLSGSYRFYNLLERHGFASVEEVAATPEACWLELRNCGTRFIAAVRQALAGLRPGDTFAGAGTLPGSGSKGPAAGAPVTSAGLPADAVGHCRSWPPGQPPSAGHRPWVTFSRSRRAWRTCRRTSPGAGTASAGSVSRRWPGRPCAAATCPAGTGATR